jgi:hypothetical protein
LIVLLHVRWWTVALAVILIGSGLVLALTGGDGDASIPSALSSAIRRSVSADRVHSESSRATVDFVAPDQLANEYLDSDFRQVIVGRTEYVTDATTGGYASCDIPQRLRRAEVPMFFLLRTLLHAKLLEQQNGRSSRYVLLVDIGPQVDGGSQWERVRVSVEGGLVRAIATAGRSSSFTYGQATVEVPSPDQVRAVADCNDALPKTTSVSSGP